MATTTRNNEQLNSMQPVHDRQTHRLQTELTQTGIDRLVYYFTCTTAIQSGNLVEMQHDKTTTRSN